GRALDRPVVGDLRAQRPGTCPVDGAVDDDPVEPRPERPAAVEAVEGAKRGEEGLLRDVLRGRGVVDDEVGGAVGERPVVAEERLDVRGRAGPGASDPGELMPARARHAPTIRTVLRIRSIGDEYGRRPTRGPGMTRSSVDLNL